jgi:hypothetical protein
MSHLPIDADPDNRSGALTSLASLGVFLPTFFANQPWLAGDCSHGKTGLENRESRPQRLLALTWAPCQERVAGSNPVVRARAEVRILARSRLVGIPQSWAKALRA